jgi:hypothetical protein
MAGSEYLGIGGRMLASPIGSSTVSRSSLPGAAVRSALLPLLRQRGSGIEDYELIAEQVSSIADRVRVLEDRLAEVESVNSRLEEAALTTARALEDISGHWDAVYEAMRRRDTSQEA